MKYLKTIRHRVSLSATGLHYIRSLLLLAWSWKGPEWKIEYVRGKKNVGPALGIILLRTFIYNFGKIPKGLCDIKGFKSYRLNVNSSFYR